MQITGQRRYWRVDPAARSITELINRDGAYAVRATHVPGSEAMRSALFPELPIDLTSVFHKPGA